MHCRRISLLFCCVLATFAVVQPPLSAQPIQVDLAPEWTDVFARDYGADWGWAGADGIWSIPLNRNDQPGGYQTGSTLFLFSDTIMGSVDSTGVRHDTRFVNNTIAFLPPGVGADEDAITFYTGSRTDTREPLAVFTPQTQQAQPGEYYWLGDGIALNGRVWITAHRMYNADNTFHRIGVNMLSVPLDGSPPLDPITEQKDFPYLPADDDHGDISHANAFLDNTAAAGAPHPDGYIYMYGLDEVWLNKYLLAARVEPENFHDLTAWRYWNGMTWVEDMEDAIRIAERVSSEFSVTPLEDGRYLLVFQLDTISDRVAVRVAPSPVGPWSEYVEIYECPQVDSLDTIVTYNAKAHPHLSDPGELLISYNVNGGDLWQYFALVDIYRPRFLTLDLPELMAYVDSQVSTPAPYSTEPTPREIRPQPLSNRRSGRFAGGQGVDTFGASVFPNPFNAAATVRLELPNAAPLRVTVHDLLGRRVGVLHDGTLSAGRHSLSLDGSRLASGTYLVRLEGAGSLASRRVTVVK